MKNRLIGMCAMAMVLRAKDGGEGGGGTAVLPEAEFQQKVFKTLDKTNEDLTSKFDNLDKETKKAFEELTRLKNQGADIEKLSQSMQKVTLAMNREKRLAFGDPVQRISGDDEMRANLNAVVRSFAGKRHGNDLDNVARSIIGKTLGEDSGVGSTLLVPQLMKEIYDTLAMYGSWNTLGVRRLGTKITQMPVKTARAAGYVLPTEGAVIAPDTAKAGTTVPLTALPIVIFLSITMQLLQDAEFDVTADIMDDFIEAFNYVLDYLAFMSNGTVDTVNGGMTGLFNFGTASVAASGHTKIAALSFEDVTSCLIAVDQAVLRRAARWWMHPFNLVQMLSIKDANGRPIFLTALEAPTINAMGSILGFPVTPVPVATPAIGTSVNAKVAAFGDPNGYVVGIRQDFQIDSSDDFLFANYERAFRGVGRAGCAGRRAQAFSILTLPAS